MRSWSVMPAFYQSPQPPPEQLPIFFVSHALDRIITLCPRSIWLEGGHIRLEGPTEEVIAAYRQRLNDPDVSLVETQKLQIVQLERARRSC